MRTMVFQHFLPIVLLGGMLSRVEGTSTDSASITRESLLTQLLNETIYDPTIAPNFNEEVPTKVTVQLFILNVYSISEASMEYSMDVILRQTWVDARLKYNDSLERLELGSASTQKVWSPDTFFYNEKKGNVHTVTTENKLIHIHQDGKVYYSARLSLTLGCSMNLHLYPLDEQFCPIILFSYAYTTANIVFSWHTRAINFEGTELAQFDILPHSTSLSSDVSEYDETGEYSRLTAKILLSRKIGHYIIQVFLPSILIVVLSWVNFWLDETAVPARVSLGVVTVLTITTMSSGIRQTLPPVSYVKAIDVWMFVCQLFVFGALLEFAFVNARSRYFRKYAHTKKGSRRDNQVARAYMYMSVSEFPGEIGRTKYDTRDEDVEAGDEMEEDEKTSKGLAVTALSVMVPCCIRTGQHPDEVKVGRADPWSRKMFPALFVLFLVVFFAYVGAKNKHPPHF